APILRSVGGPRVPQGARRATGDDAHADRPLRRPPRAAGSPGIERRLAMTDQEQQTGSVFDRLDTLSDQDLSTLVAAAADVLAEGGDDPTAQETIEMPPGPAARELQSELTAAGLDVDEAAADGLVSDDAVSREVALVTLRELAKQPELAAEIEAAWKE